MRCTRSSPNRRHRRTEVSTSDTHAAGLPFGRQLSQCAHRTPTQESAMATPAARTTIRSTLQRIGELMSVVAVLGASAAFAQSCPDKNVAYWQAFPAGGESDIAARHQQV